MSGTDNTENSTENNTDKPKESQEVKGLNTRPLPIIIVLIAAGLSCVLSIIQGKDFSTFFIRLLVSVIVFSFLGSLIKILLDFIFNRKHVEEEGKGQDDIIIEEGDRIENIDTEGSGEDDEDLRLSDEDEDFGPMEGNES